ncbi:MAG: preprotein translocase subunit SecG [Candidatus Binataceae bacterium]
MISLVIAVHVLACIALAIVILLQRGKGADIGAVFGGSSQTLFGARGAGNALTRATAALAVLFFATSIYLAFASTQRATGSIFDRPGAGGAAPSAPVGGSGATPAPLEFPAPAEAPPAEAPATK